MTFGLLDLLLVAGFGFNAEFPWWIWALAILDSMAGSMWRERVLKALRRESVVLR